MLTLAVLLYLAASSLGRSQSAPEFTRQNGKLVGGAAADIQNFPYQVSLQYYGSHVCGASVVSENWIVTAAHCVDELSDSELSVRVGSEFHAIGGAIYPVEKFFRHPDYARYGDDIALLKLAQSLQYSDTVKPIELPPAGEVIQGGTIAVVSGWGNISEGGNSSDVLLQISVSIVSPAECRQVYGDVITDRMVCAGVSAGGKGVCQGDSGGPLVAGGKLVGVVSFGNGCARPDSPGVYADVAALRSWITDISRL